MILVTDQSVSVKPGELQWLDPQTAIDQHFVLMHDEVFPLLTFAHHTKI